MLQVKSACTTVAQITLNLTTLVLGELVVRTLTTKTMNNDSPTNKISVILYKEIKLTQNS